MSSSIKIRRPAVVHAVAILIFFSLSKPFVAGAADAEKVAADAKVRAAASGRIGQLDHDIAKYSLTTQLDPRRREQMRREVMPLYVESLALQEKMRALSERDIGYTRDVIAADLAVLSALENAEADAKIEALKRSTNVADVVSGTMAELAARWWAARTVSAQGRVLDAVAVMADANKRDETIPKLLLMMASAGPSSAELAERAREIVQTKLQGQNAQRFQTRADKEGRPFVMQSTTLDGKPFSTADYKGKIVVIHCWDPLKVDRGYWDELVRIQKAYGGRGVMLVGIADGKDRDATRRMLKSRTDVTWVQTYRARPDGSDYWARLMVLGESTTLVIDRTGILRQSSESRFFNGSPEGVLHELLDADGSQPPAQTQKPGTPAASVSEKTAGQIGTEKSGSAISSTAVARPAGQIGAFETSFDQVSPLLEPKLFAQRLNIKTVDEPAFDYRSEKYHVVVPDNYDPAKQYGVFLVLLYKHATEPPRTILPLLQEKRLIFCVAEESERPRTTRVGTAINAVYNLSKTYNLDTNRVWLFDFTQSRNEAAAGQMLALGFPDVVSGSLHVDPLAPWRPMKGANGGTWDRVTTPPNAKALAEVRKSHPLIICVDAEATPLAFLADIEKFLRADGFANLKRVSIDREKIHYPIFTTDWIVESLTYFDSFAEKVVTKGTLASNSAKSAGQLSTQTSQGVSPAPGAAPKLPAKTGTFVTTYAEHSPLIEPKTLAQRLNIKIVAEPTFDYSAEKYLTVVPDDYDPGKSYGIFLLLLYKEAAQPPDAILPLLKEKRLIFCAPVDSHHPETTRVATGIDAVFNLSKSYNIDPARVWLYDVSLTPETKSATCGQMLALGFPDVVSGSFHEGGVMPWRPMKTSNGGTYDQVAAPMPSQALGVVRKSHPIILGRDGSSQYFDDLLKFMKTDGFVYVKMMKVPTDQCHYPLFPVSWVSESLGYFEAHAATMAATAVKSPTGKPTAPAVAAPPAAAPATGRPVARPTTKPVVRPQK